MSSPRSSPGPRPVRTGRLLRIGSVASVPIFVAPSWILIALFIAVSYPPLFRSHVHTLSAGGSYGLAAVYAVALAASVLAHELGHTLVSQALGLPVSRIVIFLLGGVSEIEADPTRPRDEFAIAAAGPAVSLGLAGAGWGLSSMFTPHTSLNALLALLGWSNVIVAVFNVLPGLPLDGGRIVQALLWATSGSRIGAAIVAAWCGRGVALLLGLATLVANGLLAGRAESSSAVFGTAAMGFGVAAFLWLSASQALRTTRLNQRAAGLRLEPLIRPSVFLPADTPISEAVRQAAAAGAAGIVVTDSDGRSRALVRESEVVALEPSQRPWRTLAEVSRPLEPGLILDEATSGAALLDLVRRTPASEYLVVGADGYTRGVIATRDVARALGLSPEGHR